MFFGLIRSREGVRFYSVLIEASEGEQNAPPPPCEPTWLALGQPTPEISAEGWRCDMFAEKTSEGRSLRLSPVLAGLIAATGEKWGWAQEGTNIREIFFVRTSSNYLLRF